MERVQNGSGLPPLFAVCGHDRERKAHHPDPQATPPKILCRNVNSATLASASTEAPSHVRVLEVHGALPHSAPCHHPHSPSLLNVP